MIRKQWNRLVNWLENGDLVPLVIIVSIPHYINVLAEWEWWYVASALGVLVDLGHYRTIKAFLKKGGWFWMWALTFVSLGFHIGFYSFAGAGDWAWALGFVPPILLFALAYLSYNERWGDKTKRELAKYDRQVSERITESSVKDWRNLSDAERKSFATMRPQQIVSKYGVSERTAYTWIRRSQQDEN